MANESWGRKIWRLVYPGLTYLGVCVVIEAIAAVLIAMSTLAGHGALSTGDEVSLMNEMINRTISIALELQVLAAVVTLPLLVLYYRMDRRRERRTGRVHRFTAAPGWQFVLIAVLGVATCLAGNNLITASGLYSVSDSYTEISEVLYGGKLVLEFIGLGVIVPIVEEMIFRGLMYRRLRESMNIAPAAVICSLIFAFYHGNLVQGVYAFLLSLLFIYAYERYHTMFAPILFHAAANLFSVAVSELGFMDFMYQSAGMFWGGTILACLVLILMVYLIERYVHTEEILEAADVGTDAAGESGGGEERENKI